METRKITIVSTSEQKKYVIETAATTLGELKSALDNLNINYTDMVFMEGLSRTEMVDDASLLPVNVPRVDRVTGATTTTNELVFMLTNAAKKIKSGAVPRVTIYNVVKKANLQDIIKNCEGKNYTQCSTGRLIDIVNANILTAVAGGTADKDTAFDWVEAIAPQEDSHTSEDVKPSAKKKAKKELKSPYSDSEIEEMFGDLL